MQFCSEKMKIDTKLLNEELLIKYDKIGPRYTSYPTAPEWLNSFRTAEYLSAIERSNKSNRDISLYFHIPFCKSACHYCACNVVISPKEESAEKYVNQYIEALIKETKLIASLIDKKKRVTQLHFGGGTPTYLSCSQLEVLFLAIKTNFNLDFSEDSEYSIEIDPRVTTFEQLKLLRKLGFNRISLGVQDFDVRVQKAVNRIQSYEMISSMLTFCRELGFKSVNFDLIYGLPFQTVERFEETVEKVIRLNPDRIALFNYAHIPMSRPFQKANVRDEDLPLREAKIAIFCKALNEFSKNGYDYIGMDHFAKHTDELCKARSNRTLHRNFQGYTTKHECDLFGLGMTSISSIDNIYVQNEKKMNRYLNFFNRGNNDKPPIERGIVSSNDDLIRRSIISKLLCHGLLIFEEVENEFPDTLNCQSFIAYFQDELIHLEELQKDNLVKISQTCIEVTHLGRIFLRNIGMVFDSYLKNNSVTNGSKLFSRTV